MTAAPLARHDGRSHDLITMPRAGVEESWMDVTATAIEIRADLGRAHGELLERRDPRRHLFTAHERLTWLVETARRHAGEAAGITYIHVDQLVLPLGDGCLDNNSTA